MGSILKTGLKQLPSLFLKKGDKAVPLNYRGISLLNIMSKIYTGILNDRLQEWTENRKKIGVEQAGFRREYATTDNIFTISQIASNRLYGTRRKKVYCTFVDFQKAFDSIDRAKLWEVLTKIGVSTKVIRTLKAMYKSVKGRVRVGADLTNEIDCYTGVSQGCKLSPLLFSLSINEVAKDINTLTRGGYQFTPGSQPVKSLMFADDVSLLADTPRDLQHAINILDMSASKFGLKININKTEIIVFRKGGYLNKDEKWFLQGQKIYVVNNYKYLGFTLTTKLSGKVAMAEYVGRAKAKVYSIMKTLKALGRFSMSIILKFFDAQVVPSLLYASDVWGLVPYDLVESVHMFASKKLLGVRKQTPNCLIYGETGRFPIAIESQIRVIKYWFKILKMEANRLP